MRLNYRVGFFGLIIIGLAVAAMWVLIACVAGAILVAAGLWRLFQYGIREWQARRVESL